MGVERKELGKIRFNEDVVTNVDLPNAVLRINGAPPDEKGNVSITGYDIPFGGETSDPSIPLSKVLVDKAIWDNDRFAKCATKEEVEAKQDAFPTTAEGYAINISGIARQAVEDIRGNEIMLTYATKAEVSVKADRAATLSGYGIEDGVAKDADGNVSITGKLEASSAQIAGATIDGTQVSVFGISTHTIDAVNIKVSDKDVATKEYVDSAAGGVSRLKTETFVDDSGEITVKEAVGMYIFKFTDAYGGDVNDIVFVVPPYADVTTVEVLIDYSERTNALETAFRFDMVWLGGEPTFNIGKKHLLAVRRVPDGTLLASKQGEW